MGSGPSDDELTELLRVAGQAARSFGASSHDADDLAQVVAVRLGGKWDTPTLIAVRAKGDVVWHAYIRTSVRNAYKDLLRERKRRDDREARAAGTDAGTMVSHRPGVVRRPPEDSSDLERFEARLEIIRLIEEVDLSDQDKQIAILYFIEGLSGADIARQLDLSSQFVNRRKRSVLKKLRRAHGTDCS
jgi:RNA polymerase sigma factor (sigma-70 family)